MTSWTRAWDTNPSASETFDFNAAGQLTRQKLLNPSTLVDVEYRYSASNNDGRLWQRKNWVSGEEVTYQYDQLGRLSTAATTSTAWGLSWAFDGFGNRLQQSVTKGSAPVHSVAVDGLTNRMVGQSYDANGNMLITGLSYDVDNRLAADGVYSYRYSSTNQRIRVEGASGVFAWFYGFEGEMLAVYKHEKQGGDANRTWPVLQADKERVYAMGRLLRMGTQDVVVDRGASVIRHGTANLAYYPYGEEQGGASANDRAKYATYTRDASTGLDYAWNRMYKVEWGRFTTADPLRSSGRASEPQSWNRFSYVHGDPVNSVDSTGLQVSSEWCSAITTYPDGEPMQASFCTTIFYGASFYWGKPTLERVDSTRVGAGIGTNPGNDRSSLLTKATKAAMNALGDENCGGIFNTDSSRPHTYGPGIVLQAMVLGMTLNGTYFGTVKEERLQLDYYAVTRPKDPISIGQEARALSADILLQNNPQSSGAYQDQTAADLAIILIHELGHVFNIVTSLGGSTIVNDVNADGSPNSASQKQNAETLKDCNPRLK